MAKSRAGLLFPERVRLRLVQQVPAGTAGAYVDPIFGYSWTVNPQSEGLNGTGGFQQAEVSPTLNDSSEMTVTLPPQGADGRDNVDRLYYYADTPDPTVSFASGIDQRIGYMPGDEWFELIRGQGELVQSGTPVSESTSQSALSLTCRDVTQIFRKSRETSAGFWNHAPRDVFEHYTRAWQAVLADDFDGTEFQAPTTTIASGTWPTYAIQNGKWAFTGAAVEDGNSHLVLSTIPSLQPWAYVYGYGGGSAWPLSDGGATDHSCWRFECSISSASFIGTNPVICFGAGDSTSSIPSLRQNNGLGAYTLQLMPASGQVYVNTVNAAFTGLFVSWPTNASALLTAANKFAPPYTMAIEARERWVYFYLDGQLIAVTPRIPALTHTDMRPYVYLQSNDSSLDSITVDYIIARRTTKPLNGGTPGDYVLPSNPSSGGIQGQYYDTTLASTGAPETGISSGEYAAIPPHLNQSAVRVDSGLSFASASALLTVPTSLSIASTRWGQGFTPGTTVYYKVTAYNSNGETTASAEVSATSPGSLGTVTQNSVNYPATGNSGASQICFWYVTGVTPDGGETLASNAQGSVQLANTVVQLNWNVMPGVVGYNVYMAYVGTPYGPSGAEGPIYLVDNVAGAATNSVWIGGYGVQYPPTTVPSSDTSGNFNVTLSWGAVAGATGYKIYRSTATGTEKLCWSTASTSFTDNNSPPGSTSPPSTNTAGTPSGGVPGWFPDALGNAQTAYVRWTGSLYLPLGAGAAVKFKLPSTNISQAMWVGKTRQGESILSSTASRNAYPEVVQADNPYCYFPMGEVGGSTLTDVMGNVTDMTTSHPINGTYNDLITEPSGPTGDQSTVLFFEAVSPAPGNTPSAYAGSGTSDAQFMTGSLEFWTWCQAQPASGLVSGIVVKSGAFGVFVRAGTIQAYDWGNNAWHDSGVAVVAGWQHIAYTWNSGSTLGSHLYVNGVLAATFSMGVADLTADGIGIATGSAKTPIQSFSGYVGEMAIYPYQLSVAQVYHHYHSANQHLTDYAAETTRSTSVDLRTILGNESGWYPMVFEYIFHEQDTAVTNTVGFTDNSGNVPSPTSLSPYGCFTQQVTPQDSHFDTLQATIGESFAYQWRSVPKALESGWFPGAVVPQVRVGRDTEQIMDGSNATNPAETSTAEDNALTDLASAQGLGGSSVGSLTAEAFNFAEMMLHAFISTESESLPATTELNLLTLQLATLLEFRSEAWQQITSDASAPRSMQDTWPLTKALAEFDWQPGDGLRVQVPQIFVNDVDPRQIMALRRVWYQDGIGQTSVSFRSRQRNFEYALRRFIRQFTSNRRQFQGQLVVQSGTQALSPAYSTVPLPVDLSTVRQATLTVLAKQDNSTPFAVEVNGQDTGQNVLAAGVLDISNAIGRNNAVEPQMVVRLTNNGNAVCSVSYVVSLLVLVQAA